MEDWHTDAYADESERRYLEIGKRLVSIATSGPRLWAGQNILRELVVFAEYEPRKRPDLSLSGRRQTL